MLPLCPAHRCDCLYPSLVEEGIKPSLQLGKQRPGNECETTRLARPEAQTKIQASNFKAWGLLPRISVFLLFDSRIFLKGILLRRPTIQNR